MPPTTPQPGQGLPESAADQANKDRLGQMRQRQAASSAENEGKPNSWEQTRTNPYTGTSITPAKFSMGGSSVTLPERPTSPVSYDGERKGPNGELPGIEKRYIPGIPNTGSGYSPGSVAANPIGSTPSYSPGTLGRYTNGGMAMSMGAASNSVGVSPTTPAMGSEQGKTINLNPSFQSQTNASGSGTAGTPSATITPPTPTATPQQPSLLNRAVEGMKAYGNSVLEGIKSIPELPGALAGAKESAQGLKNTTNLLQNTMQAHPENVTQDTINTLATAQRQIARNEGTPIAPGIPKEGLVTNAPVPQGMPAPVPMSSLPGAKAAATDWEAKFKKDTGTAYNGPKSAMDRLNMDRLKQGLPTFNHAEYRKYVNTNR